MRAGANRCSRMHRMAALIAHQRKASVQHAAIGQGGEKLAAVGDPRIEPLQQGAERAVGPFGKPVRTLAVADNCGALRLRVG